MMHQPDGKENHGKKEGNAECGIKKPEFQENA
jgi:hypothetical protein